MPKTKKSVLGIDPGRQGAVVRLEGKKLTHYAFFNAQEHDVAAQVEVVMELARVLDEIPSCDCCAVEQPVHNRRNSKTYWLQCFGVGLIYKLLLNLQGTISIVNPAAVKKLAGGRDKRLHVVPFVVKNLQLPRELKEAYKKLMAGERVSPAATALEAIADAACIALCGIKKEAHDSPL